MKNKIPPKSVLGTIKVTSTEWTDEYYIGEASFAIEKIGIQNFINIWANSYHYVLHENKEVLIGDVIVEIMQPIRENVSIKDRCLIEFPSNLDEVENNWEEAYFGHFYQFEHLKITNWQIEASISDDIELFDVNSKGYITDNIRQKSDDHFVECSFKAKLKSKINSRFNWIYSKDNPNARNKDPKKADT